MSVGRGDCRRVRVGERSARRVGRWVAGVVVADAHRGSSSMAGRPASRRAT